MWSDIEREKGAEIDKEVEHRRRERLKEQDENTRWQSVTREQCWLGELLRERIAKRMWERSCYKFVDVQLSVLRIIFVIIHGCV